MAGSDIEFGCLLRLPFRNSKHLQCHRHLPSASEASVTLQQQMAKTIRRDHLKLRRAAWLRKGASGANLNLKIHVKDLLTSAQARLKADDGTDAAAEAWQ